MSRPASQGKYRAKAKRWAGRVGSIELLGSDGSSVCQDLPKSRVANLDLCKIGWGLSALVARCQIGAMLDEGGDRFEKVVQLMTHDVGCCHPVEGGPTECILRIGICAPR